MASDSTDEKHGERVAEFLKELKGSISSHTWLRRWDSGLYQILVIGAATAGFASLVAGTMYDSATWAGLIGALTSVATILSQQLHCVKAVHWHERMAVELDAIRLQLLYELKSSPDEAQLAQLSEQLRTLKLRMNEKWESATSALPAKLGNVQHAKVL